MLERAYDGWAYLMRGARKASCTFTLIWDWSTGVQHDYKSHVARVELELGYHPNGSELCSNTARVLDDMNHHSGLVQLLQVWPRSTGSSAQEKHLTLLEQACPLWQDYMEVKRYIAELYLCVLALNDPIKYSQIQDCWIDRGFVSPDLFDIVHLAKGIPETAVLR